MFKDLFSIFEAKGDNKSKDPKVIKKVHKLEESNDPELGNPSKKIHLDNTNLSNEKE